MRQFNRKVRFVASGSSGLVVNAGIGGQDLSVGFRIEKSLSSSPNEARIEIINLSEGHRNALGRELTDVVLQAGYEPPGEAGNVGTIFMGQIREVWHDRSGGDIVSVINCGDGDRGNYKADVSKTFPAGTPTEDVVRYVAEQFSEFGVTIGEIKLGDGGRIFKKPYSMAGPARKEMDRLGRMTRSYWSIQNGTLEVLPGKGARGAIYRIDETTGMIGVPSTTDNGVRVRCLLNPEFRPGGRVQIVSDLCEIPGENGINRISAVRFSGTNTGNDFYAELDCEAMSGDEVDEGERI